MVHLAFESRACQSVSLLKVSLYFVSNAQCEMKCFNLMCTACMNHLDGVWPLDFSLSSCLLMHEIFSAPSYYCQTCLWNGHINAGHTNSLVFMNWVPNPIWNNFALCRPWNCRSVWGEDAKNHNHLDNRLCLRMLSSVRITIEWYHQQKYKYTASLSHVAY